MQNALPPTLEPFSTPSISTCVFWPVLRVMHIDAFWRFACTQCPTRFTETICMCVYVYVCVKRCGYAREGWPRISNEFVASTRERVRVIWSLVSSCMVVRVSILFFPFFFFFFEGEGPSELPVTWSCTEIRQVWENGAFVLVWFGFGEREGGGMVFVSLIVRYGFERFVRICFVFYFSFLFFKDRAIFNAMWSIV